MQKVFASSLLTSALAASTEGQLSAGSAASLRDAGHPLGNYSPYARTYQFPVYYPSFRHAEEEEPVVRAPERRPYVHTSVNVLTSSDSENHYSSESDDYSGPSDSSRSGDSAAAGGSDSGKDTPAGDSASDFSQAADAGAPAAGAAASDHGHADGSFSFDHDATFAAAKEGKKRTTHSHPLLPEHQYVDLAAACARATFDWDLLGVRGTVDFYQPAGGAFLLVDGSFAHAERDSRYGVAIHSQDNGEAACDLNTNGAQLEGGRVGTLYTDRKGRGSLATFLSGVDLADAIGMTLVLVNYDRLSYPAWEYGNILCHKGVIEQVACPTIGSFPAH